jgi:hypothetical protein
MSNSLLDILVRPDAFFDNAIKEKESLKIPSLIILIGGIIAAAYGYLMGELSARMMADLMPGMDSILPLSAAIGALIFTFILWLIAAGVFYIVSSFFKGTGSFSRVMEFVGYGYLPMIFGSLITLIAGIQYLPRVTVPVLTKAALSDPMMIEQATKAFIHDPAMMQLNQISTLVSIVFLLWCANIWIFGLKHSRRLSPQNAAICVGVPVVLYILYTVYNLGVM